MEYTWIEVSADQIAKNVARIRGKLPLGVSILAVVKANAYGLGAVAVAQILETAGIDWFGVASTAEGIELREAGIKRPILVQSEPVDGDLMPWISHRLTPTVYSIPFARSLAALHHPLSVHIKVDTGMNRLGVRWDEWTMFWAEIQTFTSLHVKGIYTHYANSDMPADPVSALQRSRFSKIVENLMSDGYELPWVHAANSGGVDHVSLAGQTLVRVGKSLYIDAVSIKSRVVLIKAIKAGEPISYSGRFITPRDTHVAVIGTGYSDGLPTQLAHPAVLINGTRFPVVGTVCMDMVMADLGPNADVQVGDEVVFVGRSGDQQITMDDWCRVTQKNPREVTCNMGARCRSVFLADCPAQG